MKQACCLFAGKTDSSSGRQRRSSPGRAEFPAKPFRLYAVYFPFCSLRVAVWGNTYIFGSD
jgi:hypothetical protein